MTANRFPGAARLAADLAKLPPESMETLTTLQSAADAGDVQAAATLAAAIGAAIKNPTPPAMTPEQQLEAHFAAQLEQGAAK